MRDELLHQLANEYDPGKGFIGKVRVGQFDETALTRLLDLLRDCPSADDQQVDGRMVRLLWWMQGIVEWQAQRLDGKGVSKDELRRAHSAIFSELERIL